MPFLIDAVTVYHSQKSFEDALALKEVVTQDERVNFIGVDNRVKNRGFSKACNIGADLGEAPIIAFLNPDLQVNGPFVDRVVAEIESGTAVTGCKFGKSEREIRLWGLDDWICGAAFFVEREFFYEAGKFDERFIWSWEETDFLRTTKGLGRRAKSIKLPFHHESPDENTPEEARYKNRMFLKGERRFEEKWA